MNCWDISSVEGVSQCYFDGGFQLMGEGRLWERLRIYSGKYLFNKSKFYLEKFLISYLLVCNVVSFYNIFNTT